MGRENKIRKTYDSPISNDDSEWRHLSDEKKHVLYGNAVMSAKRHDPTYKRAMYIYVNKATESKHTYRLLGTNRRCRYYGIAILTDDHRFYYNEYRTKQTSLSFRNINDMSKVFLDGYVVDAKTKILLDSSIKFYSEPLYLFLKVVSKTTGAIISRRTIVQMMNRLKSHMASLNFGKKRTLTIRYKQRVMRKLLKDGHLDFVPEALRADMTDLDGTPERRRHLIFSCALGILYMFRRDIYSNYKGPVRYNIPQETI